MAECGTHPEFECFDVGIVRSVGMYLEGRHADAAMGARVQLRDGRGLGHARATPTCWRCCRAGSSPARVWQTTLIGRAEIWPVHQRTAELGGMLRTGLEDTFYLPGGERAAGNGVLIEALAALRAQRRARDRQPGRGARDAGAGALMRYCARRLGTAPVQSG